MRRRLKARQLAWPLHIVIALGLLAGCAMRDSTGKSFEYDQLGINAYFRGDDRQAILNWRMAANEYDTSDSWYLEFGYYFHHTTQLSNIGAAYLRLDEPENAKAAFLEAANILSTIGPRYRAQLEEQAAARRRTSGFMTALAVGVGVAGMAASDTPEQTMRASNDMLSMLAQIDMVTQNELGRIESDLNSFRPPAPENFEIDFVRMPVFNQLPTLDAIGRLHSPDGWCTAAKVRPRIVLTNAHCVLDDNGRPYAPSDIRLQFPNLSKMYDARKTGVIPAYAGSEVHVSPLYSRSMGIERFANDWAFVVFSDYLPGGYFGVMGTDFTLRPGDRVAIGGYSGDLNQGRIMTMDYACPVTAVNRTGLLEFACATYKGSSGSPVLMIDPGGERHLGYIVGVNACGKKMTVEESRQRRTRSEIWSCGASSSRFIQTLHDLIAREG